MCAHVSVCVSLCVCVPVCLCVSLDPCVHKLSQQQHVSGDEGPWAGVPV